MVRIMLVGEPVGCCVEWKMGYPSFSVCGGETVLVLSGVEGVPGRLGGRGIFAPKSGDVALSFEWGMLLLLGGEVGVLVGVVLEESEAAAKPWTSSLVLGVSRVIALVCKIESG